MTRVRPGSVGRQGNLLVGLALLLLSALSSELAAREISLDDAIRIARQNNHDHLNRVDEVAMAELDYESVRANYRTQFRASGNSNAINGADLGSYYRVAVSRSTLSGSRYSAALLNSSYGERNLSELRFSYTLPFFNKGKKERNQLELDKAEMTIARRQRMVSIAEEELAAEVTQAYYGWLLAADRLEMLLDQLAINEASLERARIRRDAGELAALQYEQSTLRLHRVEQSMLQAEFQLQMTEDRLKLLLALDVTERLQPSSSVVVPDAIGLLDMPLDTLENMAVLQRQELAGQREELQLARRRLRNLSDRVLPDLDVDLQYSLIGEGNRFDDSLALDDQKWGIGLRMDTDFGASERRSRRSRLYLSLQSMQRGLDAHEQRVRVEVRSKRFDLERAVRALDIAERSHELMLKTDRQTRIRAGRGELSDMNVLESRLEVAEADFALRSARADLALSVHELELAIGGIP